MIYFRLGSRWSDDVKSKKEPYEENVSDSDTKESKSAKEDKSEEKEEEN